MTLVSVPWQLPCGHCFHLKCLEKLKKGGEHALIRDRCPYCRADSHGYAPPLTPSCKDKFDEDEEKRGGGGRGGKWGLGKKIGWRRTCETRCHLQGDGVSSQHCVVDNGLSVQLTAGVSGS